MNLPVILTPMKVLVGRKRSANHPKIVRPQENRVMEAGIAADRPHECVLRGVLDSRIV